MNEELVNSVSGMSALRSATISMSGYSLPYRQQHAAFEDHNSSNRCYTGFALLAATVQALLSEFSWRCVQGGNPLWLQLQLRQDSVTSL
jgi:hypothetical protein